MKLTVEFEYADEGLRMEVFADENSVGEESWDELEHPSIAWDDVIFDALDRVKHYIPERWKGD